jgi:hypothetical protein
MCLGQEMSEGIRISWLASSGPRHSINNVFMPLLNGPNHCETCANETIPSRYQVFVSSLVNSPKLIDSKGKGSQFPGHK